MKTFFASLFVFFALIGLIVWNFVYVRHTTDALAEMIASLPDCESAEAKTEALLAYWSREEGYLGLSIPFEELQQASDVFLSLHHAAREKDGYEFEKYRLLAKNAVEDLGRLEEFKINNLL